MKTKKYEFLNERYVVSVGADSQSKKVTYSYNFNNSLVRRFIVLPTKVGASSSYYIDLAKQRIAEEKKNGKLVRYSKRYIRKLKDTPQKKALKGALCTALIAGVAVGATFLTLKLLNNGQWHKISNDKAANIVNNIAKAQNATDFEEMASVLKGEPNLFGTIKKSGKQYFSNVKFIKQSSKQTTEGKIDSKFSLNDDLYYECSMQSNNNFAKDEYIIYQPKYKSVNFYMANDSGSIDYVDTLIDNIIDYEDATKKMEDCLYINDFYNPFVNISIADLLRPTPSSIYGHIDVPILFIMEGAKSNSFSATIIQDMAYYFSPFYMSYVLSNNSLKEASELIAKKFEGSQIVTDFDFISNEFETKGEDSLRFTVDFKFYSSFGANRNVGDKVELECKATFEFINDILLFSDYEIELTDLGSIKFTQDTKFESIEEVPHEDWKPEK